MICTPLYIEIAVHYCCSAIDFPRLDAPAVQEAVADFLKAGLLEETHPDEVNRTAFAATEGLRLWVAALCAVPWPERKWVIEKNLGRVKGGHARAASLSPERRSEIASGAAKARWENGDGQS